VSALLAGLGCSGDRLTLEEIQEEEEMKPYQVLTQGSYLVTMVYSVEFLVEMIVPV
jgi:hypothetical protein